MCSWLRLAACQRGRQWGRAFWFWLRLREGSFLVVIAVVGLRELVRGSDDGKLIQAVNESGLVGCHGWVLCRQELAWWFVATCVAKLSSQTSYQQNGAGK